MILLQKQSSSISYLLLATSSETSSLLKTSCPSGYEDLISDSEYCFKIDNDKSNWHSAKQKCLDDGATFTCFKNTAERDFWSTKCEGCWAGYAWNDGT